MEALVIQGGRPLQGIVEISGSKNAVLPILAATVLYGGKYVLHNCPDIADVCHGAQIVQALGGQVTRVGDVLSVDTRLVSRWEIPGSLMEKMRASVLFLGALLARFGRAELSMPGGCPLGGRPIDLHLEAMSRLGAAVTLLEERICCCGPVLHGGVIRFRFPSVGATENALLAAVGCRGSVTIENAATEPEIGDLIDFLQAMGAKIGGRGTKCLVIQGGSRLHDADHTVMPDRIETATYLCAVAGCGGAVTLQKTDGRLLNPVIEVLRRAGCKISLEEDRIFLESSGELCAVGQIETAPYPGFPTDAQAPLMAALLRAEGESSFTENIFEKRFGHVPCLRRFGGRIECLGNTAVVSGVKDLQAAQAEACDLRAAAALILAALQAKGESRIVGLKHLFRGYDNPVEKFSSLGAVMHHAQ